MKVGDKIKANTSITINGITQKSPSVDTIITGVSPGVVALFGGGSIYQLNFFE